MVSGITYFKGDATEPMTPGNKIIAHICNDIGAWGKGFVMAISKRWLAPEKRYKEWYQLKEGYVLGEVQFVQVEIDLWVANMIGQHHIRKDKAGNPPIRYDAVQKCLSKVFQFALEKEASIHMPRIGCGLGGGTWENIEPLIQTALTNNHIPVTVYDLG